MAHKMLFSKKVFHFKLILFFSFYFLINICFGQMPSGVGGNDRVEKTKFLPIPYINYDRSIEFTVGAVPMLMFNPVKKDTISPSSIVGLFGMYTTNKTWFTMAFGSFYLNEDKWRIVAAGGLGTVNFQFYLDNPISSWVPYQTNADFFMVQVNRKIYDKIYGGISYTYLKFRTSVENFPVADTTTLHGVGFNLQMDKRSNIYYPRKGFYTKIDYNSFPAWLQNDDTSDKIEIEYNQYFPFRQNQDVLATRFYAGLGIGNLTFNQQFIVGGTDIRGYSQGGYRGNYLLALQGEYRWNFGERMGVVGFLGFATVLESINEDDNGKVLPGIGAGFRYTVLKETQFKAGMDIAVGLDDWGIYFRISEAF